MPDLNTGIISPELPRRPLIMSDFSSVTDIHFQFLTHHSLDLKHIHYALNSIYAEPFTQEAVAALFTDANRTTIDSNALATNVKKLLI